MFKKVFIVINYIAILMSKKVAKARLAFLELRELLGNRELEKILNSSKEFRKRFKLRDCN